MAEALDNGLQSLHLAQSKSLGMLCSPLFVISLARFLVFPPVPAESPTLHVEVSMEARGFMCPFLTPMFLGYLEDRGAHWVHHDPHASTVEFALPLDSLSGQEAVTDRLVLIGYEARQVEFLRYDTLATVPAHPAP